ncbi:MAG: hypothetical protein PVI21_02245 [Candidatus Woesebacteria bacterium]|jgi:hypothetical protein
MQKNTKIKGVKTSQKQLNWFMRMKVWQRVLLILAVIAVAVVVVANLATSPSAKVSDDFLNSVQAKDSDSAYALLSSGAKETITSADFKDIVDQIGPILNTQEKTITKSVQAQTGSQPTARVEYEILGTDGVTYSIVVNLVEENGKWKVLNFESTQK